MGFIALSKTKFFVCGRAKFHYICGRTKFHYICGRTKFHYVWGTTQVNQVPLTSGRHVWGR